MGENKGPWWRPHGLREFQVPAAGLGAGEMCSGFWVFSGTRWPGRGGGHSSWRRRSPGQGTELGHYLLVFPLGSSALLSLSS